MTGKYFLAVAGAVAALGMAGTASATVYTYTTSVGAVITLNTATNSGTIVGGGINAQFTANLASFTGNIGYLGTPTDIPMTSLTGTRTVGGVVYTANDTIKWNGVMGPTISLNEIWAAWVAPNGSQITDLGWSLGAPNVCTPSPANNNCGLGGSSTSGSSGSTSTTTGGASSTSGQASSSSGGSGSSSGGSGSSSGGSGSSSGGSGSSSGGSGSSGGTPVPEPASQVALFGLAVAGLLSARRFLARRKAKA